jgi:predicted Zn-dependent protease
MRSRLTSALLSSCIAVGCVSTDYGAREVGQAPQNQASIEASLRYESDEFERRVQRAGARNTDPALMAYVQRLGCAIAGQFCTEMRFYVLDTPDFNAAMAPNGMMLINAGLLLRLESEDELAFVMAHEFGHYFENHSVERAGAIKNASRGGLLLTAGLLVTGAGALAALGYVPAMAGAMGFSRDQEREADLFAARSLNEQGYDAQASVRTWENLRAEIGASSNETTRRRFTRGSIFASHPLTEERIAYLREAAQSAQHGAGVDKAAYRAVIRPHLKGWLEAEIAQRDPGATLALLQRLQAQNVDLGVLEYARGEIYRYRDDPGDGALALASYTRATAQADAPVETWRQIGVVQRKLGDLNAAADAFERYLEAAPEAGDRQLITSLLSTLRENQQ